MRSVMSHAFSQVPPADIPRSSFNRSCGIKSTFNAGDLQPVLVDEMLPGDVFNLRMSAFARLATPIVPIMDNMFLDVFFFFTPYRLLWANWKKFNGAQDNPGDSTSFVIPQTLAPAAGAGTGGATGWIVGDLAEAMGLPIGVAGSGGGHTLSVSALPFRAYNLIWNEWFRDQNLQNSLTVKTDDGPDTYVSWYAVRKRGKRHDYFTSALPFAQKGTAVSLPLGSVAPVKSGNAYAFFDAPSFFQHGTAHTNMVTGAASWAGSGLFDGSSANSAVIDFGSGGTTGVYADLSAATAATINQLRQAFQIQRLYERDARGGTRYTEIIRAHFGVVSPDARQQRPEYLGGGSFAISINPIAQTGGTGASGTTTPQGNLAAYGTVACSNGAGFTYNSTEHGVVLGLVSVRADLNYQQCVDRMWSRSTRFDFYWPALSHLGEQSVLNREIYCDGSANDAGTFGYQERYAEYRYKPSLITGQFRSAFSTPLDMWHLAQKFTSLPVLGDTFIQENPPISRVVAVPSAPQFLMDSYFQYKCSRPMPVYSVPGLIDHF